MQIEMLAGYRGGETRGGEKKRQKAGIDQY
jgi:hypothetical protein